MYILSYNIMQTVAQQLNAKRISSHFTPCVCVYVFFLFFFTEFFSKYFD